MLVTERDLWIEKTAWQYWQVIRVLFFSFKVVGYLAAFFLGVASVLYLIAIFSSVHALEQFCIAIASLALSMFVFIGVIILPMGMLGLVANKHIYTMANIRNKLFAVVFCFCAVFSVVAFLVLHDMNRERVSVIFPFAIFLMGALYFWFAIYLMHKSLFLFGFAPLVLGGSVKLFSSYLVALPPLVIPLASIVAWVLFYRWWSVFRPVKTNLKSILFEPNPQKRLELAVEKWLYFSSNRVKTPMGSLLLGYGDGLVTLVEKLLVIYLIAFLFSLSICGGFKDGRFTENALMALLVALAYSFLISGIDFFGQRILTRLKRCWLHFSGNRMEFFVYLERTFWRGLGFLALLNLSILSVCLWAGNHVDYFLYCLAGLVIISLVLAWNFYLSIYFYSRNGFVLGEINFRKLIINLILFLPPIVYLVSKYQSANRFEVRDAVAVGFVLLFAAALKIIRFQAIKYWQQASF